MDMTYFKCPYCGIKAGSPFSLGNSFFTLSSNKHCPNYYGKIKIDIKALIILYISAFIAAIFISTSLLYLIKFLDTWSVPRLKYIVIIA